MPILRHAHGLLSVQTMVNAGMKRFASSRAARMPADSCALLGTGRGECRLNAQIQLPIKRAEGWHRRLSGWQSLRSRRGDLRDPGRQHSGKQYFGRSGAFHEAEGRRLRFYLEKVEDAQRLA